MVKCSKAEVRRLKTALRWKIPGAQRQRIQMVLLRESGMTQPAIAAAMGVSLSTVNRAHMAYASGGIKALKPKPNGGRKRENMTLAKEKALLARFAKAAGAGDSSAKSNKLLCSFSCRRNITAIAMDQHHHDRPLRQHQQLAGPFFGQRNLRSFKRLGNLGLKSAGLASASGRQKAQCSHCAGGRLK